MQENKVILQIISSKSRFKQKLNYLNDEIDKILLDCQKEFENCGISDLKRMTPGTWHESQYNGTYYQLTLTGLFQISQAYFENNLVRVLIGSQRQSNGQMKKNSILAKNYSSTRSNKFLIQIIQVTQVDSKKEFIDYQMKVTPNSGYLFSTLFVGEGNFSFCYCYTRKEKSSLQQILATDIQTQEQVQKSKGFKQQLLDKLKQEKNVVLNFGKLNAETLSQQLLFRKHRIYFNNPCVLGDFVRTDKLCDLLKKFFEEASKLQENGDQIFMLFPKQKCYDQYFNSNYDVFGASLNSNYILIQIKHFNEDKYKNYVHSQTVGNSQEQDFAKFLLFKFKKTQSNGKNYMKKYRKQFKFDKRFHTKRVYYKPRQDNFIAKMLEKKNY